jgi:3-oxoacyl-[acyl-carrier protein] reductase
MKLLEGKTAIITGAARGIGRSIAIRLGQEGANVAFTDLKLSEHTESLVKELSELGVKAKGYASDASNFAETETVVNEIVKDFGTVDILINNAGITMDTLLMRMTEQQWDTVINVNL